VHPINFKSFNSFSKHRKNIQSYDYSDLTATIPLNKLQIGIEYYENNGPVISELNWTVAKQILYVLNLDIPMRLMNEVQSNSSQIKRNCLAFKLELELIFFNLNELAQNKSLVS